MALGSRLLVRVSSESIWPKATSQRLKAIFALHSYVLRRLLKQLAAILIGNFLYFFLLTPHLPMAARHDPSRIDLGLLVDFWVCVVVYGVILLIGKMRRKRPT